ncbi:hypothetical protein Halar_0015 (plasmid) [halophilic archaeon DL31]|jgi:hypothetical protein|nr:hypothetical protein Halar_0015 [halophilic archaeon DL31]
MTEDGQDADVADRGYAVSIDLIPTPKAAAALVG